MQLNIMHNVQSAINKLTDIQKRQVPFALASTLTKTARDAEKAVTLHILNVTEGGPTPYTARAVGIKTASKAHLESRIFIKDIQAKYLTWQVHGGSRNPKDRVEVVPFDKNFKHKLNQYGNIPGRHTGSIGRWMKRNNIFVGEIKGVEGIWLRFRPKGRRDRRAAGEKVNVRKRSTFSRNDKLKLLMAFEPRVQYKKNIRFYETVQKVVRSVLRGHFNTQLKIGLASARFR